MEFLRNSSNARTWNYWTWHYWNSSKIPRNITGPGNPIAEKYTCLLSTVSCKDFLFIRGHTVFFYFQAQRG